MALSNKADINREIQSRPAPKPAPQQAPQSEQKPETGTVVNPQYEDQGKKEEESPLGKVKAGLSVTNDVSVDPASVNSSTFKAVVNLQSIDSALTLSQSILEKSKNFVFETIQDQMMSPTDLVGLMHNPNLKEYSQQVYQIEKEKFDASQAMGRNIALSLIGQVFSSASGVPGKVATTGMDTFKAGADTIQANMDAVNARNRLVDEANQKATEAMNTNFLDYVKDRNKYETDIVNAKNKAIYDTYRTNVTNMREILNKRVDADIQTSKVIESGMKEREANKRKVEEINSSIAIANLDSKTKLAVANLESATKIAIGNQVNRIAEYMAIIEAERLDRDEKNASLMVFKDAYKTVAETLGFLGVNPVLTLNGMKNLDPDYMSQWADSDSVSMAGLINALESRMISGFGDPQISGGYFGKDWDTDGASLMNASMILTNGGFTVSPEGWKALGSKLTNQELNSIRVVDIKGKPTVLIAGEFNEEIENLKKDKHLSYNKFKDIKDKDSRNAQWAVALGTSIKYSLLTKTGTEQ